MTALKLRHLWTVALVFWLMWAAPVHAGGPVETSIFAVQGVDVDVTSTDAASAKNQALMEAQVKGFFMLVERLGSIEIAGQLKDWKPSEIAPYLKSFSIEEESTAPGRYIGKFTVRYLPGKIQDLLGRFGVTVPTEQADPIIILPVWRTAEGNFMWEDTLWRRAWLNLRAEQGLVPLIIPLGDTEDTEIIGVDDALNGDTIKLEALRRRYGAPSLLVAQAQPKDGNKIHIYVEGDTPLGRFKFNKIHEGADGTLEGAAAVAVGRFLSAATQKYKQVRATTASSDAEAANPYMPKALSVSVPFSSPSEWNRIRSRILSTPNVVGVDVATLSGEGAVIRLLYRYEAADLQSNMFRAGLSLSQIGETWVIQPM